MMPATITNVDEINTAFVLYFTFYIYILKDQ